MSSRRFCIAFVCQDNAFRSIIAAHLLENSSPHRFEIFSGGWSPAAEVSIFTRETLRNAGIQMSSQSPRHITQVVNGRHVDLVVILRGAEEEIPPLQFEGDPIIGTWTVPMPAPVTDNQIEMAAIYAGTLAMIRRPIQILADLPDAAFERLSLLTFNHDVS